MTPNLFDGVGTVPPLALQLRPYQQEAVDSIFRWFEQNKEGNPLVVLPTGAGKSLVIAAFIREVLAAYPGERILVLTHVKELIAQNHAQMLRCWPGAPAGIYSAGLRRREADAPVLFAGIQSVWKRSAQIGWVDLILIDEAHLLPSEGFGMYRALLRDLLSMNSKLRLIGLTATPFRTGEGALDRGADRLFHGTACTIEVSRLIDEGYLSRVTAKGTRAEISTVGVHTQGGEFVARELEQAAMGEGLVECNVDEIVARGQDRKAWLLFCCGINHANAVADAVARRGIACATVFGDTPSTERDQAIAAFKAGELRCLVSVGVLTTGFDAPHVDLVALLRPTKSPGLYYQMTGRGLRIAPGKADCLILDFGQNVRRHGPIDRLSVQELSSKGSGDGAFADEQVRAKSCPKCQTLVEVSSRQCPDCGHEWPPPEPEIDKTPDETATIVQGPHPTGGIERWDVQQVLYWRHQKKDRPDTLCVEYRCGFHQQAREWICFDHPVGSFPRRKAEAWWRHHGGKDPAPESVDMALVRRECGELRRPVSITVDVRKEYPELKSVRIEELEAGATDFAERTPDTKQSGTSYEDIPF